MENGKDIFITASSKGIVKWGGISLLLAGLVPVIFIIAVIASGLTLPVPPLEMLENPTVPMALFIFAVTGEIILMPGGIGLYFALKGVDKTKMVFALGFWLLSVIMFITSRSFIFSLSSLSESYLSSAGGTAQMTYLISAELALEIQHAFATLALIFLCIASIIIGLVMTKGIFTKRFAYLVIFAGIWTLATPFAAKMGAIIVSFIGLMLMATWQVIAGFKLYKLSND